MYMDDSSFSWYDDDDDSPSCYESWMIVFEEREKRRK